MAKTRRAYTGGAVSTTTSSSIAASGTTSFTVTAATGWPYGSDPFFVVVEPGTASEEKILVTRAGSGDTTIDIASDSQRGQDGTVAVSHSNGATVFPVFVALDADEANELASKWSAKGDLVSYGSSTFEKLGVGSNGQFLRADSAETSGLKWETFNNTLGSGSAVRTLGTFVGGDVLQAAELNAIGTWTSFTPTWRFATNLITTTGFNYGRYTVLNDIVIVKAGFRYSSAPGGGALRLEIPSAASITALFNFDRIGTASIYDANVAANYVLTPYHEDTSTTIFNFLVNAGGAATNTAPFTWGTSDEAFVTLIGVKA